MTIENVKRRVVSVDIRVDETTVAIVDVRGNIISKSSFPTGVSSNVGDYVAMLSNKIVELVEANGGYESIRSVGVCCKSSNYLTGCIENAANLPWKGNIPLTAMLRDRLGMAVSLGNNAHARALGEKAYGVAHGMNNFILITLGGGMGSCIYSNGLVHLGFNGFAGEIGHTLAKAGGRQCGCGNNGCLETYTSDKGIVLTAHEVLSEIREPSPLRQVENLTPAIIATFCERGDALATEIMRRTGHILGIGLANYASVVNPEAIIFTGRISRLGSCLLDPAYESFNEHVFHNAEGKIKFLLSDFDDSEANLLGASVLAWTVKEYSLFR